MAYRARQGDIIWLDFDPQSGHEQQGRRPALVVSSDKFNDFEKVTAMVCPITNTDRNIPLQIRLDGSVATKGVIMCNQAKILDLQKRNAAFIERVPNEIMFEVSDILIGIVKTDI
jgi:mRNA interferase MazF